MAYSYQLPSPLPFEETLQQVRQHLAAEGFGVLCEIDVQATMQEKLGKRIPPYRILGACNPTFAHQALEAEPTLGVLLPCNVIVYEREEQVFVAAVVPSVALSVVRNDALAPIAQEVEARLKRVVEAATQQRQ